MRATSSAPTPAAPCRALLAALLLAPALLIPAAGASGPDPHDAALRALAWLRSQQAPDGGFDDARWVALAAAAMDEDASRWTTAEGATPSTWMAAHPPDALSATELETSILALVALYEDPRAFAGRDYVAELSRLHLLGQVGDPQYVNDDVFAIFALHAAGVPVDDPVVQDAAATVLKYQRADGSWSPYASTGRVGSVDDTAAALAALHVAGRDAAGVRDKAFAFLRSNQNAAGDFGTSGLDTRFSTAWVLWALATTGDPLGLAPAARAWLAGQVSAEGCIAVGSGCSQWGTWQAVHGLSGAPMPPRRVPPSNASVEGPTLVDRVRDAVFTAASPGATAWRWDFGDGERGTGATASHRFARLGSYAVHLYAEGPGRASARATATVRVVNLPPSLTLGPVPVTLHRPEALSLAVTATDPDGPPPLVSLDHGDGTRAPPSPARAFSHAYAAPGSYRVLVTAQDADGASATATATIEVSNRPPQLQLDAPSIGDRLHDVTFEAAASDPDGDPVALAWQFPDGRAAEGARIAHRFSALGTHRVRLVAADPWGGTQQVESNVTILNLPPEVHDADVPSTLEEGSPFEPRVDATDPEGGNLSRAWLLDGTPWDGRPPPAGNHTLRLQVRDPEGGLAEESWTLVVHPRPPTGVPPPATPSVAAPTPPSPSPPGGGAQGADATGVKAVPATASALEPVTFLTEGPGRLTRLDFGDGAAWDDDGSPQPPTHAYARAGAYDAVAEMTLPDGSTRQQSLRLNVRNLPPLVTHVGLREEPPVADEPRWVVWGTASDLDGTIRAIEVLLGNETLAAEGASPWRATLPAHRFPEGVDLHVRAQDDAGEWSARKVVHLPASVRDASPSLPDPASPEAMPTPAEAPPLPPQESSAGRKETPLWDLAAMLVLVPLAARLVGRRGARACPASRAKP